MQSLAEYKEKLKRVAKLIESENIMKKAVVAVNEVRMQRIFVDGINSNGGKIGSYNNTKPVYIDPDKAPKKVNQKGKNGKPIATGYYKSYKAFRQAMGRESGFVNVRLTNELQNDLANGSLGKSSDKVNLKVNPIKVSKGIYKVTIKKKENIEKVESLESRFGKFIEHTKEEKALFTTLMDKEIELLLIREKI
jgi:hypothetical protein